MRILQKYINKWVSTGLDLFGTDDSSSAQWAYVYGIKGRYDEENQKMMPIGSSQRGKPRTLLPRIER